MKKIFGVVLLVCVLAFLLGCTSNPQDLAKNYPPVKDFLAQHPNATLSLSAYSTADFLNDANFWNTNCASSISAKDYYVLKVEDANAVYKALLDKSNMTFLCGVAQNAQITGGGTVSQNIGSEESAKNVYLAYKGKFDEMHNFADYKNLVQEYGSQANVQKISLTNTMPQSQIDSIFNLMMSAAPKLSNIDAQNIQETDNGNTAVLTITTKNGASKANVKMAKENNAWKIDQEAWTSNQQNSPQSTPDNNTPHCTESWNCSNWSDCGNNIQTRACTDTSSCGTDSNKPSTTQSCVSTCTENWACTDWSACNSNSQTRTCTDASNCGTTLNKPSVSQTCTSSTTCQEGWISSAERNCNGNTVQQKWQNADCSIVWKDAQICSANMQCDASEPDLGCQIISQCTENWSCTDWSTCSNSLQSRTCTDASNCGTTVNKPALSQACGCFGLVPCDSASARATADNDVSTNSFWSTYTNITFHSVENSTCYNTVKYCALKDGSKYLLYMTTINQSGQCVVNEPNRGLTGGGMECN